MARCSAIKPNGERCNLQAGGQHGFCWAHDPANSEKRRKIASSGGRSKASKEIRDVKGEIKALITNVIEGGVDKGRGAVALQGYNTLLRAFEVEQKSVLEELAREVEELKRGNSGAA